MNKKDIDKIMEWCYQNNTIKFKELNLKLAVLDGGYVNVIELREFLKTITK